MQNALEGLSCLLGPWGGKACGQQMFVKGFAPAEIWGALRKSGFRRTGAWSRALPDPLVQHGRRGYKSRSYATADVGEYRRNEDTIFLEQGCMKALASTLPLGDFVDVNGSG